MDAPEGRQRRSGNVFNPLHSSPLLVRIGMCRLLAQTGHRETKLGMVSPELPGTFVIDFDGGKVDEVCSKAREAVANLAQVCGFPSSAHLPGRVYGNSECQGPSDGYSGVGKSSKRVVVEEFSFISLREPQRAKGKPMRRDARTSDGHRDVIVVLGAAVWREGQPSPALRRRLLHGVALMKEGKADHLLLAGGLGKYPPTEASLMKQLALEEGILESRIVLEDEGATTIASITRCARIMRSNHWNSVVVVSDSYHLFRSTLLFRLLGIKAIGSEAKGGKEANTTLKWWYYHLRELVALPWTLIIALLERD